MSQYRLEPERKPYGCGRLLSDIAKVLGIIFFLGVILPGVLYGIFGDDPPEPTSSSVRTSTGVRTSAGVRTSDALDRPTSVPSPTPTQDPLAYDTICGPGGSEMTAPQRDRYVAQFVGLTIPTWEGWVYDVTEVSDYHDYRDAGRWRVLVAMQPRSPFWSRDIELYGVPEETAEWLEIEQPVRFSGRIAEIGVFAGGICNPVTLIEANLTPQ